MMRCIYLILLTVVAQAATALNPHPRIWLTSQMLADMAAKVATNDADWVQVRAAADRYKTYKIPAVTITGATNANPVQFTVTETVPSSNGGTFYIGGASGSWTPVNAMNGTGWAVTVTGTHTFPIRVDSPSFGSFGGQSLATFQKNGCLNS